MEAVWMLVSILICDLIYPSFAASLIAMVKRIRLVRVKWHELISRAGLIGRVVIS